MIQINKMNPYGEDMMELFKDLNDRIFDESGRGAILIAVAFVDEFLTKLIEASLPITMANTNKKKLFKYPGVLSSFSSKIEMAYAFRLIEKELYNSLNNLRQIRNDAAHSSKHFNLVELNEKMKSVYNFHDGVFKFMKKSSYEMIIDSKRRRLKEEYDKKNFTEEHKEKMITEFLDREESKKVIENQLPKWELMNGLCMICSIFNYKIKSLKKLTEKIDTWDDLDIDK